MKLRGLSFAVFPQYTFDHFELERLLGSGNFSEVFEATEKGTSNSYALKVFNRNDVMRLNKVADVRMERHAMLRLNDPGHPNVIRLLETFKDEFRVCFVYELAEGGELWEHVKYAGLLDKGWALRVISQVVSALEYLHSKNIVHRDLKAENFVLTRDGVVKLIDLGTAMDLEHPEVEAPGLGINRSVGTGSFGCSITLEPLSSCLQKRSKTRTVGSLEIFGAWDVLSFRSLQVEDGNLEFPPDFDPLARDLVEKLLVADPYKRLGASSFEEIKSHPYFSPECFRGSSFLGRVFPSLQELCIRKVLKRFHSLVMDAMDKERQSRYSYGQSSKATSNLTSKEALVTEKREGLFEKRADREGEDCLAEDRFRSSSSSDDSGEPASSSKTQSEGRQIEVEFEFANHLLDEILPRGIRDQPKKDMSPHLQILIGRLEYFLYTRGRQFSKECNLADEWDQKHSHQCAALDEESAGSNHEDKEPDKISNG
ncbi:hypothetical protein Emag_001911 [Eimeria magna]